MNDFNQCQICSYLSISNVLIKLSLKFFTFFRPVSIEKWATCILISLAANQPNNLFLLGHDVSDFCDFLCPCYFLFTVGTCCSNCRATSFGCHGLCMPIAHSYDIAKFAAWVLIFTLPFIFYIRYKNFLPDSL